MQSASETVAKQLVLPELTATLRDDGIISVYINEHTNIAIALQERMVKAYLEITNTNRAFIFEAGAFVSISKKARENAVVIEKISPVIASALIVHNLGQKIIAGFYYKFNRPFHPLRVFRKFDVGID